jgi:hypothetical protein
MVGTKAKTAIAILIGAGGLLMAGITTVIICNANKPIQGIPKSWSVLRGDSDAWTWANNKINAHSTTGDCILASGKEYRDITLSAILSTTNREASLVIRMQDADNGYLVVFVPNDTLFPWDNGTGKIRLLRRTSENEVVLATYQGRIFSSIGQSAKITAIAKGSVIEVRLNDARILRVLDSTFATGLIGFRIFGDADYPCDATFSKVTF